MRPSAQETVHTASFVTERATCRLCDGTALSRVWSFGETPLANAYRQEGELDRPELFAPLTVFRCAACELVQLRETVAPDVLFRHYLYVSSTSQTFIAHFETYAAELMERFRLTPAALVVDIGSNDGILLRPLSTRGVRVLGIEPAVRIAEMASANGIETLPEFFSPSLASSVRSARGPAAVITANNVFAHVPDLAGVVWGVKELLADDGVFVFEVQYLGDLLEKNLFDIVYHEHLCYYHLTPLMSFFALRGMDVFDVQRVPVHGGSLRVFVQKDRGPHAHTPFLPELLAEEKSRGLGTASPYAAFSRQIAENKRALTTVLRRMKDGGKRIVGYGAPAKATTLLSTFGIGRETLDYIVDDDTTFKQGRYMPGSHIPIVSPDRLYADRPDACLILAWNFAEPIMKTHARFTAAGGQFIVPVPEPRVM